MQPRFSGDVLDGQEQTKRSLPAQARASSAKVRQFCTLERIRLIGGLAIGTSETYLDLKVESAVAFRFRAISVAWSSPYLVPHGTVAHFGAYPPVFASATKLFMANCPEYDRLHA